MIGESVEGMRVGDSHLRKRDFFAEATREEGKSACSVPRL